MPVGRDRQIDVSGLQTVSLEGKGGHGLGRDKRKVGSRHTRGEAYKETVGSETKVEAPIS